MFLDLQIALYTRVSYEFLTRKKVYFVMDCFENARILLLVNFKASENAQFVSYNIFLH